MKVLCLDPAGNYGDKEGWGTTGWAYFIDGELIGFDHISAKEYDSQEEYFDAHRRIIDNYNYSPDIIVCGSYSLFGNKAKSQSGSTIDTIQLIGFLKMIAWDFNIKLVFQHPHQKVRVADDIMVKEGVFEKKGNKYYVNGLQAIIHERDAIRHGIFFHRYNKEYKNNG